MKYYDDLGMGLFGWANENIGIFGGWRHPTLHPPGKLVCNFIIYDTAEKLRTGNDVEVGTVRFLIKLAQEEGAEHEIESLIELEIKKDRRKQGYGRKTIEAVSEIVKQDIKIVDIKKTKLPFWKKVGVENIVTEGKQRPTIHGWLKKQPEQELTPAI